MSEPLPRILVVDDEEAILETMTFTFMDGYEVLTSTDAERGLTLLEQNAPVSVVITDQRMPGMTGSEFLAKVYERFPETTRIILTGFADMKSTVQAINDGHIYAYVNKPWEPDELKQIVKRAYDHHRLLTENARLLEDLSRAKQVLQAVMDRLDTGAIAIDGEGIVLAINRVALQVFGTNDAVDPIGQPINALMSSDEVATVGETVRKLADEEGGHFEDVEFKVKGTATRMRISVQTLFDGDEVKFGRVILFREVSHEPLRRRFDEMLAALGTEDGALRPRLETTLDALKGFAEELRANGVDSAGMAQLAERVSRGRTAIQSWMDVDDALLREDYPDAQLLLDRMRVASQRWPSDQELPDRVRTLAERVEAYYESGENPKQAVL